MFYLLLLTVSRETPESDKDNDTTCAELKQDECFKTATQQHNHTNTNSRPTSMCSDASEVRWVDMVSGKKIQSCQVIQHFQSISLMNFSISFTIHLFFFLVLCECNSSINDGLCYTLYLWHG